MDSRFRGSDGRQAGRRPQSGRGSAFTTLMRPAKPASYPDMGRESTLNCAGWTPAFAGVTVSRPVAVPGQAGEVLSFSYARGRAFTLLCPEKCFHSLMRPAKPVPYPDTGRESIFNCAGWTPAFAGVTVSRLTAVPDQVGEMLSLSYARGRAIPLLCPGKCFHYSYAACKACSVLDTGAMVISAKSLL